MLILGEHQDGSNIIRIIIGPETLFQFNLTGQSVMDITEYIKNFKSDEPVVLIVNRCDSEEELVQHLNFQQAKMRAMEMMGQVANQIQSGKEKISKTKTDDKKPTSGVKCPKCFTPNSAIISNGEVLPCQTCQQIENGLKSGAVPPPPSLDKLDSLRKNTEDTIPEQKRSLFRFYQKESKDDKPENNEGKKKK